MYVISRSGFAMIMAIFVLVLVSLGGVMLLNNVSVGSKSVGDKYIQAQAELLAESATEFAVMRAQDINMSKNAANHCLERLNINVLDSTGAAAYAVSTTIRYSFEGPIPAGCDSTLGNASDETTLAHDTGNETMMLIDVTVANSANLTSEPIRVHKRSWQKL